MNFAVYYFFKFKTVKIKKKWNGFMYKHIEGGSYVMSLSDKLFHDAHVFFFFFF